MVKKIEAPNTPGAASAPAGPVQVESLEALAREAANMQQGEQNDQARAEQQQAQAETGQRQAQATSAVVELVTVLRFARNMGADFADAAGVLPRAKTHEIWSDEQLGSLALPLTAIMERHGSEISAFFEQYGPYVMLVGAAALPAIATVKAVRAHKAIDVKAHAVPAAPTPDGGATGG